MTQPEIFLDVLTIKSFKQSKYLSQPTLSHLNLMMYSILFSSNTILLSMAACQNIEKVVVLEPSWSISLKTRKSYFLSYLAYFIIASIWFGSSHPALAMCGTGCQIIVTELKEAYERLISDQTEEDFVDSSGNLCSFNCVRPLFIF